MIFLSYARLDEDQVKELYERLAAAGFRPWMDQKDILPGENWQLSLQRAVRSADFFLACLSNNSGDRRGFIQSEIKDALDIWKRKLINDIYLIPVRLEPCEIPESISEFQWVDLFKPDGWDKLLTALHVGLERQGKASPPNTPPANVPRDDIGNRQDTHQVDSAKSINEDTLLRIKNLSAPFEINLWLNNADGNTTRDIQIKSRNNVSWKIGDKLTVFCRSSQDCYLTLLNIGSSGKMTILLPNSLTPSQFMKANRVVGFPGELDPFEYRLVGPPGSEIIKAIGTRKPIRIVETIHAENQIFYVSEHSRTTRDIQIVAKRLSDLEYTEWAESSVNFHVG